MQKWTTYLSTLSIAGALLVTMPVTARAATMKTDVISYTVQKGNTFYEIARRFHIPLRTLEHANPDVHPYTMQIGEKISIPRSSSVAQTKSFPASKVQTTSHLAAEILHTAYALKGIHYVWGGNSPAHGFDCSGFIQYIFGVHGISLPRTASAQATVGKPIPFHQLQPGDLLFFVNTYTNHLANQVTHVALYIGHGNVIESSSVNNQGVVVLHNLFKNPWYASRYYGARNVLL